MKNNIDCCEEDKIIQNPFIYANSITTNYMDDQKIYLKSF